MPEDHKPPGSAAYFERLGRLADLDPRRDQTPAREHTRSREAFDPMPSAPASFDRSAFWTALVLFGLGGCLGVLAEWLLVVLRGG